MNDAAGANGSPTDGLHSPGGHLYSQPNMDRNPSYWTTASTNTASLRGMNQSIPLAHAEQCQRSKDQQQRVPWCVCVCVCVGGSLYPPVLTAVSCLAPNAHEQQGRLGLESAQPLICQGGNSDPSLALDGFINGWPLNSRLFCSLV